MAIEKDIRLSALVSLIKAAHLTLFKILGYRYAFSAGGYFVGRNILGEFFLQNQGKTKKEILDNAHLFFKEFVHMARPLHSSEVNFQGTVSDNQLLFCHVNGNPWATIVFVKSAHIVNAVLLPFSLQEDTVEKFSNFLKNDSNTIDAALAVCEQGNFKLLPKTTKIIWYKDSKLSLD